MKLFYKNNGVITIMLVVLLVPVLMTSTVLVEMIRYQSSSQLLDMAVNSAAMSALADYNEKLYQKFGLLAVEGEKDADVEAWLRENINGTGNVLSRIADAAALTVSVDELYALNDVDVMKRQIMEMEKYQGPFNFIEGVIGVATKSSIDDLFKELSKQLAKAVPGLQDFKAASEVANSSGEAANQCIDLYEKYNKWSEAVKAYETAYAGFKEAYNSALKWHENTYGTYEAHTPADPKGSESDDVLDSRHQSITEAKETYIAAMKELNSQWGALCDSAGKVVEKCADTVRNIGNVDVTAQQTERTQQKQAEKDIVANDQTLSDEERAARNKEIDEAYKQRDNVANAAATSLVSQNNLVAGIGNTLAGFTASTAKGIMESNTSNLLEQVENFEECANLLEKKEVEIKKTEIKIENFLPVLVTTTEKQNRYFAAKALGENDYYMSVDSMTGDALNYIKDAIKHLDEKYTGEELELFQYFDLMKYTISFITGDGAALSDSIANNTLTEDDNFVLPGSGMTSSQLGFTTGDEEAVTALLDQLQAVRDVMEYDVDSMYPANRHALAQMDVAVENAIDSAIQNLTIICEYITSVSRAMRGSVLDMLKAVRDFKQCFNAIVGLMENMVFLADNVQLFFENVLEMVYEGVMINGYVLDHFTSRADIEPYDRGIGIFASTGHTYFKYAQSEYVVAGKMDEAANQRNVTLSLYFIRFLLNVPTVLMDTGLQILSGSAGIFAPVVLILFIGIETVLDVIALQGIDCRIPIVKSHPFLSGSTLVNMASALGSKIKDKAQEQISKIQVGTDVKSIVNTLENSIIQPIVSSMFKDDYFKMDYEDYLWVRMCLVSNETKIRRIADLLYMEMYKSDTGFSLEKEYTYLRINVEGEYTTVMPLYDALGATRIKSVKYCGF